MQKPSITSEDRFFFKGYFLWQKTPKTKHYQIMKISLFGIKNQQFSDNYFTQPNRTGQNYLYERFVNFLWNGIKLNQEL